MISIITPAYNESENLPVLYERIRTVLDNDALDFEWIIIDDHSNDGTYETVAAIKAEDSRVRAFRFSKNFGSHQAIRCGLDQCQGDAAIILAADLQDPPETIPQLLSKMEEGGDIVWAVRKKRDGVQKRSVMLSNAFYRIMRKTTRLQIPPSGADFFLLRRNVIDVINQCRENNVNILFLISWVGFRQNQIFYTKESRLHGESGWTLRKKVKLAMDSMVSFSSVPLRIMSTLGVATSLVGFLYALYVVINNILGAPLTGWSSLMVAILLSSGVLMIMSGMLGEYIWRIFDQSKGRPGFIIEHQTDLPEE